MITLRTVPGLVSSLKEEMSESGTLLGIPAETLQERIQNAYQEALQTELGQILNQQIGSLIR